MGTAPRDKIAAMFRSEHRLKNYGDILTRISVQGVRSHQNTVIDIPSPIIALAGPNGIGKTTLLQLAAIAYSSPDEKITPNYRSDDFFVLGKLDPSPFSDSARVEFTYCTSLQATLSKSKSGSLKWSSKIRRPLKHVFFAGIGYFLPQAERRDFTVHASGRTADLSSPKPVHEIIQRWTEQILGQRYDRVQTNTLTRQYHVRGKSYQKPAEVVSVERAGARYSEAHMGYGEGRTQFLLRTIEGLPDQTLVAIEEPEASLHQGAQHEFGRYLLDVVSRKRHQILLTTHSEFILGALPPESRIYLQRSASGITPIPSIMPSQARSLLSDGRSKALTVLVEDVVAQALLREIIRRFKPELLPTIQIHPAGSSATIKEAMQALKDAGLSVIAVRDADIGEDLDRGLLKLPGKLPPEKHLFESQSFKAYVQKFYNVSLIDFAVTLRGVDHHDWFDRLSSKVAQPQAALITEAARAHVAGMDPSEATEAQDLVQKVLHAARH